MTGLFVLPQPGPTGFFFFSLRCIYDCGGVNCLMSISISISTYIYSSIYGFISTLDVDIPWHFQAADGFIFEIPKSDIFEDPRDPYPTRPFCRFAPPCRALAHLPFAQVRGGRASIMSPLHFVEACFKIGCTELYCTKIY
jgi:hypothetical protein